ncbi:T-cell surface glycoprotein CD3 delta chain isoform X3 [Petaurus breviceps papuanus]|uniref:T-cell surface glycoprotein CD3 delta chain isoform X3 n=1 Tax=Petaurus breviceps papuanus TaxID=3040969 RepID=UPI0036DBCEA3
MAVQELHRWSMKWHLCLAGLILTIILLLGSVVQADDVDKSLSISVVESEDKIFLKCNGTEFSWKIFGESLEKDYPSNKMCQNCVELNSGSLMGVLVADVIATIILAIGIYFFVGHEERCFPTALDKQSQMQNDVLYQPLRDRDDNSYSHIGGKRPRNNVKENNFGRP